MLKQDLKEKKPKKKYEYGFKKYNEFKRFQTNTCMRCDKQFRFKVYDNDDPRFKRFCDTCRSTIRKYGDEVIPNKTSDC